MINKAIRDKIIDDKLKGMTAGQLVIKYRVHENTIYNICRSPISSKARKYFEQGIMSKFERVV